jgi:hypothetical protein
MKSRVKGDFHARFRENAMVKVHGVTRLGVLIKKINMTTDRLSSDNLYHFKSNVDVLNSILTYGFRHSLWSETIPYKKNQNRIIL